MRRSQAIVATCSAASGLRWSAGSGQYIALTIGIDAVVTMGPSVELCGGTHVSSTGAMGLFRFTTQGGVAAGVHGRPGARRFAQAGLGEPHVGVGDHGIGEQCIEQSATRRGNADPGAIDPHQPEIAKVCQRRFVHHAFAW